MWTTCVVRPVVWSHPGGHFIPSNAAFTGTIKSFLSQFPAGVAAASDASAAGTQ